MQSTSKTDTDIVSRMKTRPRTRPDTSKRSDSEADVYGTSRAPVVTYLRVSTGEQSVEAQRLAIERAGYTVRREFVDAGITGRRIDRPALTELLSWVREGDELVVYSLSRLSRSTRDLLSIIEQLDERGVHLVSLTERIDTSTPSGRMLVTVLASLSQYEADVLRERTMAGLEAAREQGRVGGRPRALNEEQLVVARGLRASGMSYTRIAQHLSVGKSTVHRALNEAGE